ncbi:hypothetical protein M407DRAFT_26171 [Tulasnella calospora MUT 4182]|uniref:Uncharacterized protein n=1 Tax=Tulasnella calospora MUT 4182 TaxID=1051891 RepID=A0A0C3LSW9_9AGAM|nr:hypothetical protein M407DRAFT_26171 [Tulasnella calospora MUT 4182]
MNNLRQTAYALILTLVLHTYQIGAAPLLGAALKDNGTLDARAWKKKKGHLTKTGKIVFGACFGGLAVIFIGIFVGSKMRREYNAWKARKAERQRFKFDVHGRPIGESTSTTPRNDPAHPLSELPPKYEKTPVVPEPAAVANPGKEAWKEGTTAVVYMPEPPAQDHSEPCVRGDEPSEPAKKAPFKIF